jgi:hypothetical protein
MYDGPCESPKVSTYGLCEQAERSLRIPTQRERILERKAVLEKHLIDLNAALELLDKFPEFESIHNALTKVQL